MAKKKKVGRPTIFTKELLQKLEMAFSWGCSDAEACSYAEISMSSLYNYQKENPEFVDKKVLLKERPTMKAREAVVKSFEAFPSIALKYLKAKKNEEFREAFEVVKDDGEKLRKTDQLLNELRTAVRNKKSGKKATK